MFISKEISRSVRLELTLDFMVLVSVPSKSSFGPECFVTELTGVGQSIYRVSKKKQSLRFKAHLEASNGLKSKSGRALFNIEPV